MIVAASVTVEANTVEGMFSPVFVESNSTTVVGEATNTLTGVIVWAVPVKFSSVLWVRPKEDTFKSEAWLEPLANLT